MSERITTPFGPQSTADEVIAGVDLSDRRAIVTGGAGGLGRETARALASAGADVTIAARRLDAAAEAATEITETTGNPAVHAARLDLADPASVAEFVAGWSGPLHILVDNAGIMATPEQRTPEGHELQFATNHLGHFALTVGLHGALAAAGGARVVVLSSVGHTNGPVRFDDLDFTAEPYDPWLAYAQSKTANILFAVEAAKRWAAEGITVNALNPGRIWGTNLGRHIDTPPQTFDPSGKTGVSEKNIAQGAATSVLLAASPLVEDVTGRYFEDCQEAEPFTPGIRRGVAAYALDADNARRLWDLSSRLTGIGA
ncbi:SDR family NAD(P)-dependent oxidoreductase [Gryllotalpicola protaetiae]|uniref:Probable oxidoreductase n=1 Tax=Gryllotalpicola protaetiae TaxID=2419771 RepID=A0A387BTI0_9MICO|nr:SDR family NAD(P)-dependent oxidoreductase [Gryllotalpicola protaetiae]AYG04349.1 SDR family NAD(P)-dependent oxidoreductase [Gryllotalpicola protaetiae]